MKIRTAALVIAAFGAAPALSQTSTSAELAAADARKMAQGQACGWLSPAQAEALRLNTEEQAANALVKEGEPGRAAVRAAVEAAKAEGARKPCTSDDKIGVTAAATVVTNDWVIRSVAVLDAQDKQPYGARFSTVGDHATALRAGFQPLVGKGSTALYVQARGAQAAAAINRLCPERKTVRWPSGARPCPALTADDAKYAPLSRAFMDGVESFAPLYADGAAKTQAAAQLFKVEPKHPLARQNGQPLWQVYNDCSWAYFDELDQIQQAEKQAKAARPPPSGAVGSDAWMEGYAAEMEGLASLSKSMDMVDRGEAFTARAIDAYIAQTGKPKAEAEKFVKNAPAVADLTTLQCGALR